jgi:hypothetical protein
VGRRAFIATRLAPEKRTLDNRQKFGLTFFLKKILLFLKTQLKRREFSFSFFSHQSFLIKVPLGRFYSSRPSSRIPVEIVSE